jgi:pSer/pThr/pTyr-binding forkhead associated (FHA) protein
MNYKPLAQIIFLSLSSLFLTAFLFVTISMVLQGKKAILIPINTPQNTLVIDQKRVLLGRGPEADIMILDPSVSSRHCLLFSKGGKFYLKDLGSKNGTFINGEPIVLAPIKDGDLITIGEKKFLFRIE